MHNINPFWGIYIYTYVCVHIYGVQRSMSVISSIILHHDYGNSYGRKYLTGTWLTVSEKHGGETGSKHSRQILVCR